MLLSKKVYRSFDAPLIVFRVSPVCAVLRTLLGWLGAVASTVFCAVTTAKVVDTATAILRGEQSSSDIILPFALLLSAMAIPMTVGTLMRLLFSRINLNLQRKLKPEVIAIHAGLDFKHIENNDSWELIARVSRDPVKSVTDGMDGFVKLAQNLVNIISFLGLIVVQVWWAALVIAVLSAPMYWLSLRAGKKNYQAGRDAENFNRRTEYLDEVLTGRDNTDERTLFSYGNEVSHRWMGQYEAGRKLQLSVKIKNFIIARSSSMILSLITLVVALTLIGPVIGGQLSDGMFMGIMSSVYGMVSYLGGTMSNALENISRAGEYMKDLSAFVTLSQAEGALNEPDTEPISFQSLEFRDVRFKYPSGDTYILNGLSFQLESGQHYAFVGKNGAGKTTVTKLLTGLYTDYEGEILINGKELRTYQAGTLKALFSVVYQDFAKYYISLKDNITLGDIMVPICANDNVLEKVHLAGLDETILELNAGIDTPLGKIREGGQDISGGQWQRVAIARSLYSRAPIKILDEPTAALDPISESQIYEEFEKLMHGKTTVFISHRLGSTKLADEILVIDDGKISERGTHAALMKVGGQYAVMFKSQRSWYAEKGMEKNE